MKKEKAVDRLYYRPSEVAAIVGVSKQQVYRWIYAGQLKAFEVGRAWFIPVEVVVPFIESREEAGQ